MNSPASGSPRVPLPIDQRPLPEGARVVGPTPAATPIRISIIVKRKNPLHLSELNGRQISREEFDARYAADPAAFDLLRGFAQEHGLAVDETSSSLTRRTMVFYGTAEQMRNAFEIGLQEIDHKGQPYRLRTGTITMPQACANLVEAVLGFDTQPQARAHYRRLRDLEHLNNLRPAAAGTQAYYPRQVAQIYQFPAGATGAGQTIGIEKTLIGIRRKVDGDGCCRGDARSDFNVEHHFAVRAVRITGRVGSAIDRDGDDGWRCHALVLKILLHVGGGVAAA